MGFDPQIAEFLKSRAKKPFVRAVGLSKDFERAPIDALSLCVKDGREARALVHEFAHATWGANRRVPYTDEVYELLDVEALARRDPVYARNNADSYALYATEARTAVAGPVQDAPADYFDGVP